MGLPLALGVVDGVVGAYLLWYAVRRPRRNRGALIVVAVFLLLAAAALGSEEDNVVVPVWPPGTQIGL